MTIQLLPHDFDDKLRLAVSQFWNTRSAVLPGPQSGTRDSVVGGKNLDGFANLVREVAVHCGISADAVHTRRASAILPGFFRGTKTWDVLVIHERRLLAVFEFKSQVGSFGNNFNNRTEEAIGSAADLWVAHHHGAYSDGPRRSRYRVAETDTALLNPSLQSDPRPPFVGWLMLLEDSETSNRPVRCDQPHFKVFPEFEQASYANRYQILCERLVERGLYSAAALELTAQGSSDHRSLSDATSIRNLFAEFAGRVLAAQA